MNMYEMEPVQKDYGEISVLFGEISFMIKSIGLFVGCDDTYQTLQFYDCEKNFKNQRNPLGAIQYEKNYTKVNFRFYRDNISDTLREKLESLPILYRQDTEKDKLNGQSIAFKFSSLEVGVYSLLLEIYKILQTEFDKGYSVF